MLLLAISKEDSKYAEHPGHQPELPVKSRAAWSDLSLLLQDASVSWSKYWHPRNRESIVGCSTASSA
jgi:hypothetical protein